MKAVRFFILAILALWAPGLVEAQTEQSVDNLVKEFKTAEAIWRRFEVAKKLVARGDKSALPALESWLNKEDRPERCVAAFVFAGLGNGRGLEVIIAVLNDMSDRPVTGAPPGNWSLRERIRADRHYAVYVLGELKDKRVVPLLIPLLRDEGISFKVAWALGEIGDDRAVGPLIEALHDKDSAVRLIAIQALEKLRARDALPHLHALLNEYEKIHYGAQVLVAEAAKAAVATLETKP
jgi:HEAT repeat protein